jgi:hypothetical protein
MISSSFQYTADEWESIAIAAPAKLNDADWRALRQIAATCPSVISAIPNKRLAAIERASKKLAQLLEKVARARSLLCLVARNFHTFKIDSRAAISWSTEKHIETKQSCAARRPRRFFNEICPFLHQPGRARGQRSGEPLCAFRHCRSRARAASSRL